MHGLRKAPILLTFSVGFDIIKIRIKVLYQTDFDASELAAQGFLFAF